MKLAQPIRTATSAEPISANARACSSFSRCRYQEHSTAHRVSSCALHGIDVHTKRQRHKLTLILASSSSSILRYW